MRGSAALPCAELHAALLALALTLTHWRLFAFLFEACAGA